MSELLFDDINHIYTVDGVKVPSVTEILSCVGRRKKEVSGAAYPYTPWMSIGGGEYIQDADQAAHFGTVIHACAAMELRGIEYDADVKCMPWIIGVKSAMKLLPDRFDIVRDGIEQKMYSKVLKFAGTPDYWCETKKEVWLLDWKTSTSQAVHWRHQLAGYEILIREYCGIKTKKFRRLIVRLFDGGYYAEDRTRNHEDKIAFLSLLNVYNL